MSLTAAIAMTLALGLPQAAAPQTAPQTAPAATPQTPPDGEAVQIDGIVVEGRRLESYVNDFVSEVGEPARRRGLARWHGPVCVGVVNLRPEVAQYMVDRVSDVARELGLSAGEPGCRPNILIVASTDSADLAKGLVTARRRNFNPGHLGTNAGTRALREFQEADRPVRWWQLSLPVNSETGDIAVRLPGMLGPDGQPASPQINVTSASRLRSQIRDDMARSLIIIDVDKLAGTTFQQLTDYVALIALAQINPEADTTAYPTVLNLFTDPEGTTGLTDWDMTYLRALYEPNYHLRVDPRAQSDEVARLLVIERRAQAEDEAAQAEGE